MSLGTICDPGCQQFNRRPKPIMAVAGFHGRCHKEPEIARINDLDLLPIGARLPARLWDEPETDAAGQQGQLQVIALDFRAEVEMSALAIERSLQSRSEAASSRIEHPSIETKFNNAWCRPYCRPGGREYDDWLLREAPQLQILVGQLRFRQEHEGGVERLRLQRRQQFPGPLGRDPKIAIPKTPHQAIQPSPEHRIRTPTAHP